MIQLGINSFLTTLPYDPGIIPAAGGRSKADCPVNDKTSLLYNGDPVNGRRPRPLPSAGFQDASLQFNDSTRIFQWKLHCCSQMQSGKKHTKLSTQKSTIIDYTKFHYHYIAKYVTRSQICAEEQLHCNRDFSNQRTSINTVAQKHI